MRLELIAIASACVNISVGCLVFYIYFNFNKIIIKSIKMNAEELIDISQAIPQDATSQEPHNKNQNESDYHYCCWRWKSTILRTWVTTLIDKMSTEEINKLYCRYEARLGTSMTKTLGNSFISLYVMGVSRYFNVVNPPKLINLEAKESIQVTQFSFFDRFLYICIIPGCSC